MYYLVLVGSQRYHGSEPLTYVSDKALTRGAIVKVPLGKQEVTGVILRQTEKPAFPTKSITFARQDAVIPSKGFGLLDWIRQYYPSPMGQAVELFTPPSLTKAERITSSDRTDVPVEKMALPPLTAEQASVLRGIHQNPESSILLQGVTGSGKTRVYFERAQETLQQGRSVLILTPEIGLTQPLVEQTERYFGEEIIVQHSAMTPSERRAQWLRLAQAQKPTITIGARSALFLPHRDLGLIIVDEAHDSSYKQSQSPRYSALRVAGKLRELHRAQLIFGTATPLVSERYQFESRGLPVLQLSQRALHSDTHTERIIVDSRDRSLFTRSAYLSGPLINAVQQALDNHEQSLLFLNKRGSARMVLCQSCGWQATCSRCDVSLTFHADTHDLRCHSCDTRERVPTNCPTCQHTEILFKSIGTKALEAEAQRLFPHAQVARFDSDTHKDTGLAARSKELQTGKIDIIIGTQTVTKGFDLPLLSVVGVVQADTSLGMPDFTAQERTFQLINQVSGRIGRGHRDGTLIVQTYTPDNSLIQQALADNYDEFYRSELRERQTFGFPPFAHIMTVSCARATRQSAMRACEQLKELLHSQNNKLRIDGPAPRFIEKPHGKYAWHLVVRSGDRSALTAALKHLPTGWTYDLDPNDLL